MSSRETLSFADCFESPHDPFTQPCSLMREFSTIICILRSIVNHFGHQLPVCNPITPEFICHDLSGLPMMALQQSPEEALCRITIPFSLEIHIHHFNVLIYCSPEIVLFAAYLYEHLINEKCIAITLMLTF
jgi:hypothetical protein